MIRPSLASGLMIILAGSANCLPPGERVQELHRELAALHSENARLRELTAVQNQKIETLERGMENLSRLGDRRLDKMYRVQRLEIGRLSGGRDLDGQPGDDAVAVYLQLYDEEGNPFKAAGEIQIQVFDLDGPDAGQMIAQCLFDVDAARELWYGQLLAYHYKVSCPWTDHPPSGRQVTVRATFLDYLTGRVLQDTRQLVVEPFTRPAVEPGPGRTQDR